MSNDKIRAAAEQALAALDRLPADLGRGSLNGFVAQAAYALRTALAEQPHPEHRRPPITPDLIEAEDAAGGVFAAGALAEQPQPRTTEQHIALREAHEIAAERDYFNARPHITNDGRATMLFEAGFRRGFDAGRDVYALAAQPAPSKPPAAFAEWVAREIPPGTIISDPAWWAPKMWRAAMRAHPAPPTSAPEPSEAELPPLPKPGLRAGPAECREWYSASQMREYALRAAAAARGK